MGMGVLGVVLLSLFASFTFGFSSVKLFREEMKATQILQEKAEVIRCYTWAQINNPKYLPAFKGDLSSNAPAFYRGTVKIGPASMTNAYSDNLRQVDISVTWTNSGKQRVRSTRTFVSAFGIQNYVFNYE